MQIEYAFIDWLPDYRFGSDGSVWSCRKQGRKHDKGEWKLLTQYKRPYGVGYRTIGLRPKPGGKLYLLYVHRLILEAFKGKCPEGMWGCHNDGNTENNSIDNLRWDYPLNNLLDKVAHGTLLKGEDNPRAKLTDKEVKELLVLRQQGWLQNDIAAKFNITQSHVSAILRNNLWKHIPRGDNENSPQCQIKY